jgi:glycyl-tRNA synthetase
MTIFFLRKVMNNNVVTLEKIVALCKRRGFVYPTAEMYGGLNGLYDFGPLGTLLKQNIKTSWQKSLEKTGKSIVLFDGAILGSQAVWDASGHTKNFHDPLVDCLVCKKRFRADEIDIAKHCPSCGNFSWTPVRQFNLMFSTNVGALEGEGVIGYLRPETAQTIFANFKNIISTTRVKIPFGVAQIGKAFRNEITPKQFLFRMREFEQMEFEWFCKPEAVNKDFEYWVSQQNEFVLSLGIAEEKVRTRPHAKDELAHYSSRCVDLEYLFPFGWKELEGIADRGNYDLTQHSTHAKKDLSVTDETGNKYMPHVVESSIGVDRLFLTILFDAYYEDIVEGETRTVLRLSPHIAPIPVAVFPLTNKLTEVAEKFYLDLRQKEIRADLDTSGSIGKRYRRYDEIGTPFCVTVDFDTLTDQCVTVRNRDTLSQERISLDHVIPYLKKHGIHP